MGVQFSLKTTHLEDLFKESLMETNHNKQTFINILFSMTLTFSLWVFPVLCWGWCRELLSFIISPLTPSLLDGNNVFLPKL